MQPTGKRYRSRKMLIFVNNGYRFFLNRRQPCAGQLTTPNLVDRDWSSAQIPREIVASTAGTRNAYYSWKEGARRVHAVGEGKMASLRRVKFTRRSSRWVNYHHEEVNGTFQPARVATDVLITPRNTHALSTWIIINTIITVDRRGKRDRWRFSRYSCYSCAKQCYSYEYENEGLVILRSTLFKRWIILRLTLE